ncbi:WhiB family transcriptional regulator [Streptomyces sp. NPDC051315]|uniref:WhiB family transcriptional regulator n=1 Tax=Streptomyces sp. NPDC051315 TaxID=3365650 RepID=UPI00378BF012
MSRYAWMGAALGAQSDPDQWTSASGSQTVPKRICQRCPVQPDCAAHAAALQAYDGIAVAGVWGALSKKQRDDRRMREAA